MEKRKFTASEVKYLSRVAIDLFETTDKEVKEVCRPQNGPERINTDQMNYVANLYMNLIRTAYPLQESEVRNIEIKKTIINAEEFDYGMNKIFNHLQKVGDAE